MPSNYWPSRDQLANDTRKIAWLLHGLFSFANSTRRRLMPAHASYTFS
jgi:hypothetical protein